MRKCATTRFWFDQSQIAKEEALMEAEDIAEAKFDQQKADYVRYLLTELVAVYPGRQYASAFRWEVWQDWFDSVENNTIELVRLNLACGDREKAGMVLVESLEAYMDEIAAQAVREHNKQ